VTTPGERLMHRLAAFARHSDEPGKLTRLYLSPAHKAAVEELTGWMQQAGMSVSVDALGTVIGRYEGKWPDAPALLIGSHIDSVRDAGRYDGPLGVLAGLVVVEELARSNERLPFAIEIVAFGDEEGVRFPDTFAGSRAMAGTFDPTTLDGKDSDGISLRDALVQFGCDPTNISDIPRKRSDLLAYIETHIEQGPVLEAENVPVGVVTAINGQKRFSVTVTGEASHAGTVPMRMRRDAYTAAADMALAIENIAQENSVVATVGRVDVAPGAVNVIPGQVRFTVDVRAPSDSERDGATEKIENAIRSIAARRNVVVEILLSSQTAATACSPLVITGLSDAIARQKIALRRLPSGAGHDAMIVASLCPVGMLFVRCKGGVSHNPAESITVDDADACVRVLLDYVRHLDVSERPSTSSIPL
jgi:hydantoinase/carbamoylase family amidase